MRYRLDSLQHDSGQERHSVGVPRRGINRERARHAVLAVLRRGGDGGLRAAFTVVYSTGQQLRLGGKGGYAPEAALEAIAVEQQDPIRWLEDQLHDRRPARPAVVDQVIIDLIPRRAATDGRSTT